MLFIHTQKRKQLFWQDLLIWFLHTPSDIQELLVVLYRPVMFFMLIWCKEKFGSNHSAIGLPESRHICLKEKAKGSSLKSFTNIYSLLQTTVINKNLRAMYIPTLMSNSWQEIAVKLYSAYTPRSSSPLLQKRKQKKLDCFLKNEIQHFFFLIFKNSLATIKHTVDPVDFDGLECE